MQNNIVIIGGSNIDICAKTDSNIILHDSNIGHIEFGLGGVGRNIAEILSLFGADVSLLTAVGNDSFGRVVTDRSEEIGIRHLIEPFENAKTGVYAYSSDYDGSFILGINDMGITDKITPKIIEENLNSLLFSDFVLVEANLSKEAIEKVGQYDLKIIADCVSGRKCKKVEGILDKVYLLKSNRIEAFELTGTDNVPDAVKSLVKSGVKRGIITLGSEGGMCFENLGSEIITYTISNMPGGKIADANGCGDAFLAGFVFGLMRGHDMKKCLVYGESASYLNAQVFSSVNRKMDWSMLKDAVHEFEEKVEVKEQIAKLLFNSQAFFEPAKR